MRRVAVLSALLLLLFVSTTVDASAATDVVTTITGERIVGEIKKVDKDVLTIETVYSDSDLKIKWDQIASIESDRRFLVETFAGTRLTGELKADAGRTATLRVADVSIALADVSTIDPYERSFWSRVDAGFDFGYTVTEANSAKNLTFGGTLLYREKQYVDSMLVNVFKTAQSNAPDTQRWDIGNDFRYLFGNRWYANTTQDFTQSDEQGLDLRTTLGGGGGRYLLRSSSQYLGVGGGLAWTQEAYQDDAIPTTNSAEGYVGTEYMTEKLKVTDLITRFTYYRSLTVDSRYRINLRFDLDFNLPGDWYFRSGVFDNFDSQPPAGLSSNDFGWSNSFGLKF